MAVARILCPVDFSATSRQALLHAIVMAGWYGAEITGLFVAEEGRLPSGHDLERRRLELQQFLLPAVSAGIPVTAEVLEGRTAPCIAERAESLPADLLVIGTRGPGGRLGALGRLVLGSVTEAVLRTVACPVLTVPAPGDSPVVPRSPLSGTILCPVDFTETTPAALSLSVSLAREAEAHLVLMHVLPAPHGDPSPRASTAALHQEHARRIAGRLRSLLEPEPALPAPAEVVVASGKPAQEILRLASERSVSLIVMGVAPRGAADLMLFGSTTSHLLEAAHAPVLTIRSRTSQTDGSPLDQIAKEARPA